MRNRFSLQLLVLWALSLTASQGGEEESLYEEQDYQAAYQVYDRRLEKDARHRDKLEYGAGTAAYKADNFDLAAEHLGRAILTEDLSLQAKAYYNLGNTLFQLGKASEDPDEIQSQWESAISHYREAEALGGSVANNASHNREIVEKHLEALQKQQDDQQDDQKKDDQKKDDQKEDDQKKDDQKKDDQKKDGEQKDGEQKDGEQKDGEQKDGEQKDGEQKDGEQKDGEQKDGEQKDGEQKDGEQKDGEQKDGEQKDGEQKDGEQQPPNGQDQDESDAQSGSKDGEKEKEGEQLGEKEGQEGEVKPAAEQDGTKDPKEVSAYELTPDGKLSEAAARALLESLEGQEIKAPFEVRRSRQRQRVIRDW